MMLRCSGLRNCHAGAVDRKYEVGKVFNGAVFSWVFHSNLNRVYNTAAYCITIRHVDKETCSLLTGSCRRDFLVHLQTTWGGGGREGYTVPKVPASGSLCKKYNISYIYIYIYLPAEITSVKLKHTCTNWRPIKSTTTTTTTTIPSVGIVCSRTQATELVL
jgi:hypothetical protein